MFGSQGQSIEWLVQLWREMWKLVHELFEDLRFKGLGLNKRRPVLPSVHTIDSPNALDGLFRIKSRIILRMCQWPRLD